MTTTRYRDLDHLVAQGELELVSLSDEQWDLVGLLDVETVDAVTMLTLAPALKSMVAAGLATVTEEGVVGLSGGAALVQDLYAEPRPTLVVVDPERAGSGVTSWAAVSAGVVVRHEWEYPGVHRFFLQSLPSAVSELVAELIPAGSAEGDALEYDSVDDPRLAQLRAEHPKERRLLCDTPGGTTTETVLLHGGSTPGWLLGAADGGYCAEPADRKKLRRFAQRALLEAAD